MFSHMLPSSSTSAAHWGRHQQHALRRRPSRCITFHGSSQPPILRRMIGAEHPDRRGRHREAVRLRLRAGHVQQHDGADQHQGDAAVHGAGAGPGAALQPHGVLIAAYLVHALGAIAHRLLRTIKHVAQLAISCCLLCAWSRTEPRSRWCPIELHELPATAKRWSWCRWTCGR